MSEYHLSNKDISRCVGNQLKANGWSIRACVKHYNERREHDSEFRKVPRLNKDFLLRVKNNNFEITNERVAKLCDFLGIEIASSKCSERIFQWEFERVESLAAGNPHLRKHISALLNNIVELADNLNEAKR